jgi:hypothetical protein
MRCQRHDSLGGRRTHLMRETFSAPRFVLAWWRFIVRRSVKTARGREDVSALRHNVPETLFARLDHSKMMVSVHLKRRKGRPVSTQSAGTKHEGEQRERKEGKLEVMWRN